MGASGSNRALATGLRFISLSVERESVGERERARAGERESGRERGIPYSLALPLPHSPAIRPRARLGAITVEMLPNHCDALRSRDGHKQRALTLSRIALRPQRVKSSTYAIGQIGSIIARPEAVHNE